MESLGPGSQVLSHATSGLADALSSIHVIRDGVRVRASAESGGRSPRGRRSGEEENCTGTDGVRVRASVERGCKVQVGDGAAKKRTALELMG